MKNLFLSLMLVLSSIAFSQKNINLEFYDYLVDGKYIDVKTKYDSNNVKTLIDSLKNYVIEKKRLELPKVCNQTNSYILDLNDYMNCFAGSFLESGTLMYYHFPIEGEFNKEEVFSKFEKYISENMVDEVTPGFKVYFDIFNFEHEITTSFADPINFISYETKETTNNCFIFFIIYL